MTKAVIFIALSAIATASAVNVAQQGNRLPYIGTVKQWTEKTIPGGNGQSYSPIGDTVWIFKARGERQAKDRATIVRDGLELLQKRRSWNVAEMATYTLSYRLTHQSENSKIEVAKVVKDLLKLFAHQPKRQFDLAKTFNSYFHYKAKQRSLLPAEEDAMYLIEAIIAHFEDTDTTNTTDDSEAMIRTASRAVESAHAAAQEEVHDGLTHAVLNQIESSVKKSDRLAAATAESAFAVGHDETRAYEALQEHITNHRGDSAKLEEIGQYAKDAVAYAEYDESSSHSDRMEHYLSEAEQEWHNMGKHIKREHKDHFTDFNRDVVIV